MISPKEISKINADYHDIISTFYDTYQEQNDPKVKALYRNFFQKIFTYFKKRGTKKLRILDIGCGTGYLEQYLMPEHHKIIGIDVSKKLLEIAKKKFPTVEYKLQDAYSLRDGSYDLIVENSVLHHIKDYKKILAKMVHLLKPHGCIFLGAEPNYFCYRYLSFFKNIFRKYLPDKRELKTPFIKESYEKYAEYHMYFSDGFKHYELRKFFLKKGFKNVEITFSSREFFAGISDRVKIKVIDYIPNILMDSTIKQAFLLDFL